MSRDPILAERSRPFAPVASALGSRCRMRGRISATVALTWCLGVLATHGAAADTPDADALQARLERPDTLRVEGRDLQGRVLWQFYRARDFAPVWGPDPEGSARATLLLETLAGVANHGLDPAAYHVGAIHRRAAFATERRTVEWELLLTDALLRYATDVRVGRVRPAAVETDWGIPPAPGYDPLAELAGALEGERFAAWVSALPPPHGGYARLTEALRGYRVIADRGGWRPIPAGLPIVPGHGDARLPFLRRRLALEGDLRDVGQGVPGDPGADAELERAVRRFQSRHGQEANGVVGPDTVRALNVPVGARMRQTALNLERWRWLPRHLGNRHLVVNAADATLTVVEDGRIVLSSRVVVGDPEHPTPVVQTQVTGLVVNPAWSVPTSIAREEFLLRLRLDPRFLADNDMVILERLDSDPFGLAVDWAAVSPERFPFRFQQRPGPMNPLGRIKFVSSNRFDVFLHDTPLPSLFERADRALSHGCVRVERARDLAAYVLAGQPARDAEAVKRAIANGATRGVPVSRPLPVFFLYWTVSADEDGALHFREDVYGRDERLAAALSRHARSRTGRARAGVPPDPR